MTRPVRIVELVGPPGAGKTSLAKVLLESTDLVQIENFPYFRDTRSLSFFFANLVLLTPTLINSLLVNKRGLLTKRDIALMTILSGWNKALEQSPSSNGKVIVLEEGAICLLAKLYGFGSDAVRNRGLSSWWKKTYRDWADTLDIIVLLNTPILTLLDRIRSREEQFEFSEMPDLEATSYLDKIQQTQRSMIDALLAVSTNPRILCFDTSEMQADQIAKVIISFIQD